MQIVIDIPEYIYKLCQGHGDVVYKYIAKGTPLPKGHGRLIDADKLKTHFVGTDLGTDLEVYLESTIIEAPTIIEAYKEGENA